MPSLTEKSISCPYCGEDFYTLVDDSVSDQDYIEDCQVCCRPIALSVSVDLDGDVVLSARSENE